MHSSPLAEYMQKSIGHQKKLYGAYIDSCVMLQAELERTLAFMYSDFQGIPVEIRDMVQDLGLRMKACRSAYKKLINAQFDYYIQAWGKPSDERA